MWVVKQGKVLSNLFNIKCGEVSYVQGSVIGGNATIRGQWPFLVALHHLKLEKFFCGGNLFTSKHVLTGCLFSLMIASILNVIFHSAAHCIQNKNQPQKLQANEFVVLLGRFNLARCVEPYAQQKEVNEVHMNPDWRYLDEKWDADLAILELKEVVAFTSYIQPICIPNDTRIENFSKGTVVS